MKTKVLFTTRYAILVALLCVFGLSGCEKSDITNTPQEKVPKFQRPNIGFEELINLSDVSVTVLPRSTGGYSAEARGRGTIPSGEYAGWKFQITISAHYSGEGNGTLESGSALVKMRGERFVSVVDPFLQSFCCGEGDIVMVGTDWVFSVYGQVSHSTASPPHNHLFAAAATTAGTMNMNIQDQSDTVVEQADPPHDPGIGEIFGFDAHRVEVIPD
jgi:hypothetical protein